MSDGMCEVPLHLLEILLATDQHVAHIVHKTDAWSMLTCQPATCCRDWTTCLLGA